MSNRYASTAIPKDFSIRPSSPLTWCSPNPRSVFSSRLICSTGHLHWYALITCRGIHSSRLVTRIFVRFGPMLRPRLLRTTVTSPMCRRHRRVLYSRMGFGPNQAKGHREAIDLPRGDQQGKAHPPKPRLMLAFTPLLGHGILCPPFGFHTPIPSQIQCAVLGRWQG